MPSGYKTSDVPGIYQPLFNLLEQTTADELVLTDKEVAAIIGRPLPETAILQTFWWTNKRSGQVQAWKAMGWVAHTSAAQMRARFTRESAG